MVRIGLTGGFGAGKTTVAAWLQEAGIPVLDADAVTHQLLGPEGAGVAPVIAAFGPQVAATNGGVDRQALAALVFADTASRRQLEAILHPLIIAAGDRWLAEREQQGQMAAVIEAALIFEAGSAARFDKIIAVTCPPEIKIARCKRRGGPPAQMAARLSAQLPDEEKSRRADWTIDNSGPPEAARAQVRALAARLLAEAAMPPARRGS